MTEGYLLSNLNKVALFHQQNDFMFTMWIAKVHTNIGKSLIAQHSMTHNAQAVAVGMVIYYQDSTAADRGKRDIFQTIMIGRLDRNNWLGNYEQFIMEFADTMSCYNNMCGTGFKISEDMMMTFPST